MEWLEKVNIMNKIYNGISGRVERIKGINVSHTHPAKNLLVHLQKNQTMTGYFNTRVSSHQVLFNLMDAQDARLWLL